MLVAISIPIFSKQLQKARLAVNQANAKAAEEACAVEFMSNDEATKLAAANAKGGSSHNIGWSVVYIYDTKTGDIVKDDERYGYVGDLEHLSPRENSTDKYFRTMVLDGVLQDPKQQSFWRGSLGTSSGPSGWTINTEVFGYNSARYTMGKCKWKYFAVTIDANGVIQGRYASMTGDFKSGDNN